MSSFRDIRFISVEIFKYIFSPMWIQNLKVIKGTKVIAVTKKKVIQGQGRRDICDSQIPDTDGP